MEVFKARSGIAQILYVSLGVTLISVLPLLPDFMTYATEIFISVSSLLFIAYAYKNTNEEILESIPYVKYMGHDRDLSVTDKLYKLIGGAKISLDNMLTLPDSTKRQFGDVLRDIASDSGKISNFESSLIHVGGFIYKLSFITRGRSILCLFQDVTKEIEQYNSLLQSGESISVKYKQLNAVIKHIPLPVVARNSSMDVVYYNQPYYDLAIGSGEAFDPKRLDIAPDYKKSASEAFITNKKITSERSITIDSKKIVYRSIDIPVESLDMVITILLEIEEIFYLQELVKGKDKSFKQFVDSLLYGCMVFNADGILQYANSKMVEIWGIDYGILEQKSTHSEILDHLYLKGKLPASSNYTKFKHDRISLRDSIDAPQTDYFYLRDGRYIRSCAVPLENNSILFTYEDLTKGLDVERALNFANSVRDSVIQHLREGVCVFNNQGGLEVLNPDMLKIWGLDDKKDTKITLQSFLEKSFIGLSEGEKSKMENAFSKALVSNIEVEQVIKAGDDRAIHRRIASLPNKGIMIADMEVTHEYRRMAAYNTQIESLLTMDRDKSKFIATMPNKMRGAISSLIGINHILLTQNAGNLSEEQKNYLEDIRKSVEYLSKMLDESEDLSEFTELHKEVSESEINLVENINDVVKMLHDNFELKNIKCKVKMESTKLLCFTDEKILQNAITSILQNVIYRSKMGGKVEISITIIGNKYHIKISDDGMKYSDKSSQPYNIGLVYTRLLLASLNTHLQTSYSSKNNLSSFEFSLLNDRAFVDYSKSGK